MRSNRPGVVKLLKRVIAGGWLDAHRLAAELVTDEPTIQRYLSGELDMTIDRQICLARLLVEHVPALEREGHNFLSQLRTQIAYERSETVTHDGPPMPNARSFLK